RASSWPTATCARRCGPSAGSMSPATTAARTSSGRETGRDLTGRAPGRAAGHNGRVIYEVVHTVLPPVLKAIWRPRVTGLDNIPDAGGVIIASNHLSFVDSVVIPSVVSRKVVFLAKSDYFNGRGVKG